MPWSEKFPDADPQALDLMDKMLQFHPGKRIDVATALKHPWLAQLHDETQEPAAPGEAHSVPQRRQHRSFVEEWTAAFLAMLTEATVSPSSKQLPGGWSRKAYAGVSLVLTAALHCVRPALHSCLPAAPFEFDFEDAQLTEQNVRDLVFEEMLYYHPDLAAPMAAVQPPIMHQKHFVAA